MIGISQFIRPLPSPPVERPVDSPAWTRASELEFTPGRLPPSKRRLLEAAKAYAALAKERRRERRRPGHSWRRPAAWPRRAVTMRRSTS